tara:strand:+ start:7486 stop:7746 length:261 start_codon:yes stop_codon:yes gene_type:complete
VIKTIIQSIPNINIIGIARFNYNTLNPIILLKINPKPIDKINIFIIHLIVSKTSISTNSLANNLIKNRLIKGDKKYSYGSYDIEKY